MNKINNLVAKNAFKFNKAKVQKSKKDYKRIKLDVNKLLT